MAMGRLSNRRTSGGTGSRLAVELAPRHAFYDRCNKVLAEAEFDETVEMLCQPDYADGVGRPSIPPGRYFRMLFVGQFEGLASEREIAWRCADSLSLHRFLRLDAEEMAPDHTTLSLTRSRLPLDVHHAVFGLILEIADKHDLVTGKRLGVDASTQAANAALRRLVRRDSGEDYRRMLERLARESGIKTPTTEDLIRLDRTRKGKCLSNADWASPTDPEARIAKMKDGTTHLAYKPEHAVDLDSGVIVAAKIHAADHGDTRTLAGTLEQAEVMLGLLDAAPSPKWPSEVVADKGYHSREVLKGLEDSAWKSRIAEKRSTHFARWHGDTAARRAVYNNRARLLSGVAHHAFKLRAEKVERSFALILDIGGLRRTWLRGVANVEKRYSLQVAADNLGLVIRRRFGVGTPRQATMAFWLILRESWAGGCAICAILLIQAPDATRSNEPVQIVAAYLGTFSI
ncbi:transposase [Azospirillum canadense]|uniref:transposase n=1 Tax=Azospirillum canadense TaxID=403962 RepID=UPI0022261BBC|nr:transposase [Azospirillum canadense]MCW2243549.1 transposase [Azospirillum canadense]